MAREAPAEGPEAGNLSPMKTGKKGYKKFRNTILNSFLYLRKNIQFMKQFKILIVLAILATTVACNNKGDKYAFQYVTFKQNIPYTPGKEHPACTFNLHILQAHGSDTVFADAFNLDISEFMFGKRTTDVRGAMIHFIDSVIEVFRLDNKEQIDFAKEEGYEPRDIDYEFTLNTEVHYGNNKDIIGHFINYYQYTGGAHGGTFITCRNYRLEDGSVVTLDNYFKPGYEKVLLPILERKLLEYAECSSRDELDEHGYFSNEPMFVSDNFEIRQDTIDFIYNQYDIAPYSTGITTLSVPNDEIRSILR